MAGSPDFRSHPREKGESLMREGIETRRGGSCHIRASRFSRGLRCSWEGLAVLDSLLLTLLPRLQEAWQQKTPAPVPGG